MKRHMRLLQVFLLGAVALVLAVPGWAVQFPIARIYIEYNSSANDLGFHVFLDAEDWKTVNIVNPNGDTIFEVAGSGAYEELGLTELFFEGAEPNLDDFPLEDLLDLFPEGKYIFNGVTVGDTNLTSRPRLSHAIPAGPVVSSQVNGNTVVISWTPVTAPPPDFPDRPIDIVGYQVIVGSFQVTLPDSAMSVEVPEAYIGSLAPGTHPFEVLAIDVSGNQTITEGSFTKQ